MRRGRLVPVLAAVAAALPLLALAMPAQAGSPGGAVPNGTASTPLTVARATELTETTRLADRRALVTGDRLYSMSAEDGSWPAAGFHTRGEMGGIWSSPIKLLDGVWFGLDGHWLPGADSFTSGYGYVRRTIPATAGVRVTRLDFVPDGLRAGLIGLVLSTPSSRTVTLAVDAHSELSKVYPWGETNPSQLVYNLPDSGTVDRGRLVFTERGTPPVPNAEAHDYAAVVSAASASGARLRPAGSSLGPDFRGPQDPPVICPASGPNAPPQPPRCDDTAYGKGTGGQLRYQLPLSAGKPTVVWVAVAGSDRGLADASNQQNRALANPFRLLADKLAARAGVAGRTVVDLPGDRLLQRSVEWTKQMLADSVQQADNLRLRPVSAGTAYPPAVGTLASARWIAAGFPDYPWMFGTDGEYTAFPAVAAGQFEAIEAHLRSLARVSDIVNARSGKIVHEVVSDGSVYFGANADAGNTDETAKFPSAVALVWRWTGDNAFRDDLYDASVRAMRYIYANLDADGDGWPEGLGNVERPGMGTEKLDNAVYTIRGLTDLADMAASRGDATTAGWASGKAADLVARFEGAWWFDRTADQYADSLADPGDVQVFQRHWIGLTPTDALLANPGGHGTPLASVEHANLVLDGRQQPCYSDTFGLYHTGTGPTSAEGGNHGATCDSEISSVQSERVIFSLNTAIMAVSEGNYGRMGAEQQQRYTTANARIQLDPSVWEQPGAMPEIAPSPDFGANIDRLWTERSSVLQAWGAYGVLWPVVSQQLGVAPDLGRGLLSVVPQIPAGQDRIAGQRIRLGGGSADVSASRAGTMLTTQVSTPGGLRLTLGAVLPAGAHATAATLDGHPVGFAVRTTARGQEVVVVTGGGQHVLQISTA
jgi:hypothetical protein